MRRPFSFGNVRREWNDDGLMVVHRTDLSVCGATDLRLATEAAERKSYWSAEHDTIEVSSMPVEFFDEDFAPLEPYSFSFDGRDIVISLQFESGLDDDVSREIIRTVLIPLAQRYRLVITTIELSQIVTSGPPFWWVVTLRTPCRARRMAQLVDAAEQMAALLAAFESGQLTRESARDLILSGNVDTLHGQVESDWLEAKSTDYDLSKLPGKVSLAGAVAALANAAEGGLVVVGLKTQGSPSGGERIVGISPMRPNSKARRQYRAALQNHLYPPPFGLTLHEVSYGGGRLMLIDIPPQPEELKPFLVHGALVAGKAHGAFIGIAVRQGDENVPQTAAMIHSTLVAGRALIRGSYDRFS